MATPTPEATTTTARKKQPTALDLEVASILADPAYFIRNYCKIQADTGAGMIPFDLFGYQEDLLDTFLEHKQVIVLKARQLGITELVCAYVLWFILKPYQTVILISKGQEEADEMLNKILLAWENLPAWLKPARKNERKTSRLELVNGSRVIPKPATAGAGRSHNAQLLVFDEWAHQAYQDRIFGAAKPTTSAGNQILGLSTALGVGNLFHRLWTMAEDGIGFAPVFLPWSIRPGRDQAWYDENTLGMEEWLRHQEFPANAAQAFALSGRPRFDHLALDEIQRTCENPALVTQLGTDNLGRPAGHLRVWESPVLGRPYVVGADVAEGLLKGDFSSAVLLDWLSGVEVAELHGHWAPEEFAHYLADLAAQYNQALLAVERNNHGHSVLLALQSIERYPNLYAHKDYDKRTGDAAKVGWQTSTKSKPIMVDGLAQTIMERRPYRNALFVAEARTYVIKDNGETEGAGTSFDDRVMAYAIAEQMRPRLQGQAAVAGTARTVRQREGYRLYG